jgi:hypothetical protein
VIPSIAPGVTYAALGLACVLAWALASRQPAHRPIALLLSAGLLSDLARRALRVLVLAPARAEGAVPFTGGARVAAAGEVFLFLSWPAAIAAAALFVYLGRRPWAVGAAWLLVSGVLVAGYPTFRGELLGRCYLGFELAAVACALFCVVRWYPSKGKTSPAQASLALLVATETVSLVGAWRVGVFDNWQLTQALNTLVFAVLSFLQGGFLWQSRRSS